MLARRALPALCCALQLLLAAQCGALHAQSLYKYRDASGSWVYTDRQPPAGTAAQTLSVDLETKAPRITVQQSVGDRQLTLLAINDCACEAEYALRIDSPGNLSLPPLPPAPRLPERTDAAAYAGLYHAELPPHSQQPLLTAAFTGAAVVG